MSTRALIALLIIGVAINVPSYYLLLSHRTFIEGPTYINPYRARELSLKSKIFFGVALIIFDVGLWVCVFEELCGGNKRKNDDERKNYAEKVHNFLCRLNLPCRFAMSLNIDGLCLGLKIPCLISKLSSALCDKGANEWLNDPANLETRLRVRRAVQGALTH